MERPNLERAEDRERVEAINEIACDSNADYCTVREFLDIYNTECPNGGCGGDGWCEYRQRLFDRKTSPFHIKQGKLIAKLQYIENTEEGSSESTNDASYHFCRMGSAALFREAWDNIGIRDIDTLMLLCVHAARDTPHLR